MNAAVAVDARWSVSTRSTGEVLTARLSEAGVEILVIGIPAGFSRPEVEAWLRDILGVARDASRADSGDRPIPALLHHLLSGLLFSHAELWSVSGGDRVRSMVFLRDGDEVGMGWVGEGDARVEIGGRPYEIAWTRVRDEAGREARALGLDATHTLSVATAWSDPADPARAMEIRALWDPRAVAPADASGALTTSAPAAAAGATAPLEAGAPRSAPAPEPAELSPADLIEAPHGSEPPPAPIASEIPRVLADASAAPGEAAFATPSPEFTVVEESAEAPPPPAPAALATAAVAPAPGGAIPAGGLAGAPPAPGATEAAVGSPTPAMEDADAASLSAPAAPEVAPRVSPEPREVAGWQTVYDAAAVSEAAAAPGREQRRRGFLSWIAGLMGRPAEPGDARTAPAPEMPASAVSAAPDTPARPAAAAPVEAPAPTRTAPPGAEVPSGPEGSASPAPTIARIPPHRFRGPEPAFAPAEADAPAAGPPPYVTPPSTERQPGAATPPVPAQPAPAVQPAPPPVPQLASVPFALPPQPAAAGPQAGPPPSPIASPAIAAPPRLVEGARPIEAPSGPAGPPAQAAPPVWRPRGLDVPAASGAVWTVVPAAATPPAAPAMSEAPAPPAGAAPGGVVWPAWSQPLSGAHADPAVAAASSAAGAARPTAPVAPPAAGGPTVAGGPAARPPLRPAWPEAEEAAPQAVRPLWMRPWAWGAMAAALLAGGWLVGGIQDEGRGGPNPLVRAARVVGLGGARFEVTVQSRPPGAWIAVNGKDLARRTPAQIELPPGAHQVTLSFSDLGSATFEVRGERGDRQVLDAPLWGSIEVRGADLSMPITVAVDGQALGFVPVTLDSVLPGAHEVRFSGPGMPSWGQAVTVRVGEAAVVLARPMTSPATGMLDVRATLAGDEGAEPLSGAAVWVDGERRGVTPLTLELPRGPHSVRVEYQGERAPVQVIDLPGGNQRFATFEFGLGERPRLEPIAPPARIPLDAPTVISGALRGVSSSDVREMWLHVRTPDGTWRRYEMAMLKASGGVVGVAVYPPTMFDEGGRARWYLSAATHTGDEFFTEMQSAALASPPRP
uniref:PEGA domain-containing protein n=1 Tax=Eiseniibacteriota bacterium TaxID=2212470 RepID=A0A832MK14_UNCEI